MSKRSGSMPEQSSVTTYQVGPAESYTEAIVAAVADVSDRNTSPLQDGAHLDSLYESIDPDALEALFERSATDSPVTATFSYSGYRVTVDATGFITIAGA
ncbi:HalOD1 output domain-containing protein [Halorientalis marina]|uniref:HalOD1 output domain-containing protein n=1 Tax=Halorientalis marina TaxID=2931976 RepID=UPI001FF20BB3|nr:HalOD1 output domain-containing protein [Halorientalis marina]